jgi:hypothetical protein
VEAFVRECGADRPSAIAKLIDAPARLHRNTANAGAPLARCRTLCRHVRQRTDYPVPQAYKYRDYVMPRSTTTCPTTNSCANKSPAISPSSSEAERERRIVATGYLASARHFAGGQGESHLTIEDAIENMGRSFLGLSLSLRALPRPQIRSHFFHSTTTRSTATSAAPPFPHPGSEGKNRPEISRRSSLR